MDIKIVFHPSGDWEGLYIDGVLYEEGHSISVGDFISAYNKASTDYTVVPFMQCDTRDLGNEEGFDAEDFNFPLKYEEIDESRGT
jgi:hypothetical protein